MPNSHIEDRYSDQVAHGAPAADERRHPARYAQPYAGGSESDARNQVESVVDLLYRRKWSMLLIFALIVGGVAAYTFTRTPLFQSSSYVMVDLGTAGPIAGEVSLLGSNSSRTGGRSLTTELFVLQSSGKIYQRVRDRLTQRADISEGDFESNNFTGEASFPIGSARFTPASREVTNAIAVTATSPNPADAALLANIYAEEYVRLTREASRTHLSAQVEFLQEQEALRLSDLQEAEEVVKAYTTQNDAIALSQETSALVSKIASLEAAQDEARIELRMREQSLAASEEELERISPRLVDRFSSTVELEINSVTEDIARLQDQKSTIILQNPGITDSNPRLAELDSKINDLKSQLRDLSTKYVEEVREAGGIPGSESSLSYITELKRQSIQSQIELDGFRSRIDMMEQQLASSQAELNNIPELSLDLARLERTRQHADQLYQRVVSQLQQARLAEQSEPGYAEVIRSATVPPTPFFPDPNRNMMLAIFFGLMAGLGWAVVRDRLDNRIYKPDQLKKGGHPVSGIIPNMAGLIKEDFDGKEFAEVDNGREISTRLVSLLSPMSSISESYRAVRTAVQFSLPDTVVGSLMITSPSAGEGKSTTAANLAILMAQSGRRTLLIDGDLRRPQIHRMFGKTNKPGLVQMLFKSEDAPLDLSTMDSGIDNLFVLTAGSLVKMSEPSNGSSTAKRSQGTVVSNPAELLGSKRMRDLLHRLEEEFDMVIIDTPPVLAGTDSALISTQCDASLMVVRAGQTREGELDYAWDSLQDVGARLIGTIFNGFDVSMAYGYKYRYGSYSKYGHYSKYGYSGHKSSK